MKSNKEIIKEMIKANEDTIEVNEEVLAKSRIMEKFLSQKVILATGGKSSWELSLGKTQESIRHAEANIRNAKEIITWLQSYLNEV